MSWRTLTVEEIRLKFILAYHEKKFNLSELCRQFGISRTIAYKWIARFETEGVDGLSDRSKRPLSNPYATSDKIIKEVLDIKYQWPTWGPKKVLAYLIKNSHYDEYPSRTTVENILKKNGLVERRKLKRRLAVTTRPFRDCNACNDTWCMDFKGWWISSEGEKCEPFTMIDAHSRFLLCCQHMNIKDVNHTWAVLERLFREFGLPSRIRSDNGTPFASFGAGRLSRLGVKLIKAGVTPEWIEPGNPQQNGRLERMHLTLKNEAVDKEINIIKQQDRLNDFAHYYNFIRPHEGIFQKCPAEVYTFSKKQWNGRLVSPEYTNEYKVGRVLSCGKMNFEGKVIYVGRAFNGEPIGVKKEEGDLNAYYGPIFLGSIGENNLKIKRNPGRYR